MRLKPETGTTTRQLLDDISEWLDTEGESRPTAKPRGAVKANRTIQLGQTLNEVTSIFGPPEKQVLLGIKRIFVYSDLKVVFVDGKVTDAEKYHEKSLSGLGIVELTDYP